MVLKVSEALTIASARERGVRGELLDAPESVQSGTVSDETREGGIQAGRKRQHSEDYSREQVSHGREEEVQFRLRRQVEINAYKKQKEEEEGSVKK